MLNSSKKIFVGRLDPSITNGNFIFLKIRIFKKFFSYYLLVREAVVLFYIN